MILAGVLSVVSAAERTLDTEEVNALLKKLTTAPASTWLSEGTIRARYLEYRADEEIAYESEELFRFDGRRFYWDIQLQEPPADTATPAAERPDYQANKHRIFAYDGNAYTRYYKSADYAVVVMNQDEMPMQLFGPSAAGASVGQRHSVPASCRRSPVAVEYRNGRR